MINSLRIYQVQSACDYVKAGAGWLSGQRPPKHEDSEKNIADLRARLQKTIAFAESVTEAQYAGAHDRKISWPAEPGSSSPAMIIYFNLSYPTPSFTSRWRTQFCVTTASNLESGTFLGRYAGLKDKDVWTTCRRSRVGSYGRSLGSSCNDDPRRIRARKC